MSDNNLEDDGSIGMEVVQEDGLSNIEEGQLNHAGTQ